MPPAPRSSTPFPYTTLFRSIETRPVRRYYGGEATGHLMGYIGEIDADELASDFYDREPYEQGLIVGKGVGIERQYEHLLQGDRKSTRLNSSHSQISYAVFCL